MEPSDERAEQAARTRVLPVDLRDYVAFSTDAAQRRRVLTGEQLAMDVWCLEPRQSTPVLHEPARDVTYTVVGGRSWFVTDEGEVGLDPMGAMLVRAGTVHGIDNRAADPLIVVAVSAPPSDAEPDPPVERTAAAVHVADDRPGLVRRLVEGVLGVRRPTP